MGGGGEVMKAWLQLVGSRARPTPAERQDWPLVIAGPWVGKEDHMDTGSGFYKRPWYRKGGVMPRKRGPGRT